MFVTYDEQGGERDAGGEAPDEDHPDDHPLGGALDAVLERFGDGVVAVDADHAQVEDGGGAAEDVEADPEVADDLAEDPAALDLVEHRHGHDEDGDAQVADGQADQEVVGGAAQLPDEADRDADEDVADDGADDDHHEDDGDDDGLGLVVAGFLVGSGLVSHVDAQVLRYVGRHTRF